MYLNYLFNIIYRQKAISIDRTSLEIIQEKKNILFFKCRWMIFFLMTWRRHECDDSPKMAERSEKYGSFSTATAWLVSRRVEFLHTMYSSILGHSHTGKYRKEMDFEPHPLCDRLPLPPSSGMPHRKLRFSSLWAGCGCHALDLSLWGSQVSHS